MGYQTNKVRYAACLFSVILLVFVAGCDSADVQGDRTADPAPRLEVTDDIGAQAIPADVAPEAFDMASKVQATYTVSKGQWKSFYVSKTALQANNNYEVEVEMASGDGELCMYSGTNSNNAKRLLQRCNMLPGRYSERQWFTLDDLYANETRVVFWIYGRKATTFSIRVRVRSGRVDLNLKLPINSARSYMLTTEAGSGDCATNNQPLPSHLGSNWHSLDFSPRTEENGGNPEGNVLIVAPGDGVVTQAGFDMYNGHNVTIDLDNDANVNTGYQARILHLAYPPFDQWVNEGQPIKRGEPIGIMGATGDTGGNVHLHFGLRYQNDGSENIRGLDYVRIEGLTIEEYQTRCSGGIRTAYYPSTTRYWIVR